MWNLPGWHICSITILDILLYFQHDTSSDLNSEALEFETNSHMTSTLLVFVLVIVNNESNLSSSQRSRILQKISCVGKSTGFPAPRNSSMKPMLNEWDLPRSTSAIQVAGGAQLHLRWNCQRLAMISQPLNAHWNLTPNNKKTIFLPEMWKSKCLLIIHVATMFILRVLSYWFIHRINIRWATCKLRKYVSPCRG